MDIREIITLTWPQASAKMLELGYTQGTPQRSPFYATQTIVPWQRVETVVFLTVQENYCVSVSVYQPYANHIREWVESSTTVVPDAKLQPSPGTETEVREDSGYWYSIRKNEDIYNVTVTKKDFIPPLRD